MPLDDSARLARLEADPRTDRPFPERVARVVDAQHHRLARTLSALDPQAAAEHHPVQEPDAIGAACTLTDGPRLARGHAGWIQRREGRAIRTTLTVTLEPTRHPAGSIRFILEHRAQEAFDPDAQTFAARLGLDDGVSDSARPWWRAWERLVGGLDPAPGGGYQAPVGASGTERGLRGLKGERGFLVLRQLGRRLPDLIAAGWASTGQAGSTGE